ncbi:MAG: hypothetical protein GY696_08305 [Gammaproteobacteria bacterium]|nr:hypothetical protein [Gammaproteobacteria bacterium]
MARQAFVKSISLLDEAAGFLQKKFVERKMAELNDNLKSCIYRGNSSHTNGGGGGATNGFHDGGAATAATASLKQQNQNHFQNLGRLASIANRNKKFPALSDKVEVLQAG